MSDERRELWFAARRKKLGVKTDDEVRAHTSKLLKNSPRNTGKKGGFGSLTKEERREIALKGVRARGLTPKNEQENREG